MTNAQILTKQLVNNISQNLSDRDFVSVTEALNGLSATEIGTVLERFGERQRAVIYRLLPKQQALNVFEVLPPPLQADLVHGLQDADVAALFAELDPDDRLWLLDELPAGVASRLMRGLPERERQLTGAMLGYKQGSIGRRMSPEFVSTRADLTVRETMARVQERLDDAETVYTLPVVDDGRRVVGVVSLRELLGAEQEALIGSLARPVHTAEATDGAEQVARRSTELGLLATPIVDSEGRLVGIFTIDDAVRILEHEETEDAARQGGVEPLRRPYLAIPIQRLVQSRAVWLLVLAVGATLTVQVLSIFEDTLAQVTVLALFVPLLIGTGGNTGNQAATTVTRALALDEVNPRDVLRVLTRELRTGFLLGLILGAIGFLITGLVYDLDIGLVIGLTLVAVCTVAASIGGVMPLIARKVRVDPAVFSNPFITTFVDATGLIIYFLIARAILHI